MASYTAHITEHLLPPLDVPAPLTESATLAASVNASLTPRFRFAEHSAPATVISSFPATANHRDTTRTQHTQIPQRLYPLCDLQPLLIINHDFLPSSVRSCFLLFIATPLPQIALQRHKHELHTLTIFCNFAHPFRLDVLERIFRIDAEAEHDSVGIIVRKGA